MIAAARAPALGATNAWGHGLPLVKGSSCSSLLDRSQQRPACGARSSSRPRRDICTSWQWRPRQRLSTTRPWAPSPQWPPTREHSLHSTQPMAELSVVRQIDKQFEANGRGYPRPTRDQTDVPAPSPTPARATGSASHEGRSASGSRSSPDAASPDLNLFCVLVSGRRRRRGSLPGARPGV